MSEAATFLFADLAGYTALTEAHGDEYAADLAHDFASKVRSWLPEFGDASAKLIGDALMIRLEEASSALGLGLAIVERTSDTPRYPHVRVGINSGSAAKRGDDWFGAAVNLAARVAAVAESCEVLLTQSTADLLGELPDIELESLGERRFRNVTRPTPVFRASRRGWPAPDLSVDPVCRMSLRGEQPVRVLVHDGREFHFCSQACAELFASDPGAYGGNAV
ncbi:MAG: YHS domain-containing protein [Actinomycetota bacterium]|nr:YHS domain-containing protein [Actinomycetota bacterium]